MRDDIANLPLSRSTKRYARMTSRTLGKNWSKKTDMFMDMVADTTNQSKDGFRNRDAAGKVQHAMKGIGEAVVGALLDESDILKRLSNVATMPIVVKTKMKKAYVEVIIQRRGIVAALGSALASIGVDPELADGLSVTLTDGEAGGYDSVSEIVERAVDFVATHHPSISEQELEGVRQFFMELAMDFCEESLQEGLFRAEGDYYYVTCCVNSTAEKIHAMVDAGHEVSKTEFFKNVPLREVFEAGIAQIYAWTPAQCRAAGVDYEEVRQNKGGLKMWNDWAIGYYKSVYDGQECYYFDHSRIEYIFCKV